MHLRAREAQIAGHEVRVVRARGDEAVHGSGVPRDERLRPRAPGLAERLEEEVLALERADDRTAEGPLQRRRHADEQGVRQDGEVERRLVPEEADDLPELLGLETLLSLERRDGEGPEVAGVHGHAAARRGPDHRGPVPQPVEDGGGPPEERHVLLEVDADPAEGDVAVAHVGLVGERGRVDGQEQHVVPAREKLAGEGVVAQAAPAVHASRPGGDLEEAHVRPPRWGGPACLRDSIVTPASPRRPRGRPLHSNTFPFGLREPLGSFDPFHAARWMWQSPESLGRLETTRWGEGRHGG